jgi:allantoate deiminase
MSIGESKNPGNASNWIEQLAGYSDSRDGLSRLYLSGAHKKATAFVAGLMQQAGMTVQMTPLGDVVGHYSGVNVDAPCVILGSHIDTVRNAGKYDGALGVLAAIETVGRLHAAKRKLPFGILVAAFGDEEGVRFPSTLSGSKACAGFFNPGIMKEVDEEGVTREAALKAFGCGAEDPVQWWKKFESAAYIELHIEQGPVLESENLPLGIVTGIAGATRGRATINGEPGHAGTVPRELRRDALAGAAEMILAVEQLMAHHAVVATVGTLAIENAARNTIPGEVSFSIDLRNGDDAVRELVWSELDQRFAAIAARRKLQVQLEKQYAAAAAPCDGGLIRLAEKALGAMNIEPRMMVSGAGHDAMAFKDVLPFGMLFMRCRGGLSHSPLEFASPHDVALGVEALHNMLDIMARDWPQWQKGKEKDSA